jgi:hypothetical protein
VVPVAAQSSNVTVEPDAKTSSIAKQNGNKIELQVVAIISEEHDGEQFS